jgi:4-aminobutyrate aminotransferase
MVNLLGYDVAEVREAVDRQLDTGISHTSTLYLIRQQVELAERIVRLSGIEDAKVFFTNSGTEAVETALLLATQFRRSNRVIALRNGYHGRAFGSGAVTSVESWSASPLSPLRVSLAPNGSRTDGPLSHVCEDRLIDVCVGELRDLLKTQGAADVACLIAEPVQGVGGITTPPPGLLAAYQQVLAEHGILFVSDEVQTAWGRLGTHFWGSAAHGVVPDAMAFAKGLGNGFAIGGVVARGELMDCLTSNSMSTFGGNPLASTAACATLDYLLDHDLQANAHKIGSMLRNGLLNLAERSAHLGEIRGTGLLLGVEIVAPGTGEPDPVAAGRLLEETRRTGLLVGRCGPKANVIRITPPLTITESEAADGLARFSEALLTLERLHCGA